MNKYEVYQTGKLPPLTVIEAERWGIDTFCKDHLVLYFHNGDEKVAMFNWNNVAGFRELESEEIK